MRAMRCDATLYAMLTRCDECLCCPPNPYMCNYAVTGNKLRPLICQTLMRVSMKLAGDWEAESNFG